MMHEEFERIAGYEVSAEDYNNIIEPMYMATDLDKYEFVKTIDRKRFEVKHEKTEEEIQLEEDVKNQIEDLKRDLKWYEDGAKQYEGFYKEDGDNYWKVTAKNYRETAATLKARIKGLKWVLTA